MKFFVFVLFLLMITNSSAEIFSLQDHQGNIIYSDVPLANSTPVNISPNTEVVTDHSNVTTEVETKMVVKAKDEVKRANYTTFLIVSPQEQETIQNQPAFPVEVSLYPALQEGDRIQMVIDGKPVGDPINSTHLQVSILERGTHTLEAVLIDANNVILQKSNRVTIFVHRNSVLTSPASF